MIGPGWGNGKAIAARFARERALVACVDRDEAAAELTAGLVMQDRGRAVAIGADAIREAEIEAALAAAERTFGGIDILVNNVGIAVVGGVAEFSDAE